MGQLNVDVALWLVCCAVGVVQSEPCSRHFWLQA